MLRDMVCTGILALILIIIAAKRQSEQKSFKVNFR